MVSRPSTQTTLDVAQAAIRKLEKQIRARLEKALQKKEQMIEQIGTRGAMEVIQAIAKGSSSVSKIGSVTAQQSIRDSQLGRYILSSKGAGELGIPDPDSALDVLIASIPKATDIRVRVFRGRITIVARFIPTRLIKMNPHPGKSFLNGSKINVESWLQWTVGPRLSGGTPGFGLARVGNIVNHLTTRSNIDQSKIENIIQSSRTLRIAGNNAGLMLSIKPIRAGRKSPFESLTGDLGESWSPLPFGNNFWSDWWKSNSKVMKDSFRRIAGAMMSEVAEELEKR